MRPLNSLVSAVLAASALVGLGMAGCQENDTCRDVQGVHVCGEFGNLVYNIDLTATPVEWPPVAMQDGQLVVARGKELLRITKTGGLESLGAADKELTVPSQDGSGNLMIVGGDFSNTQVASLNGSAVQSKRWTATIKGAPVGTPASIGNGRVYVATSDNGGDATLHVMDSTTGQVSSQRTGASPAAVLPDGSIRYLQQPKGFTSLIGSEVASVQQFGKLVAEDAAGKVLWTREFSTGAVDFAPGPKGETYVVTAQDHKLVRVSDGGEIEWSFQPDCQDCTVASAPTVTRDVVYFPVWEKRVEPIDPLYAIDAATGAKRWVYDGFSTKQSSFSPSKFLAPASSGTTPVDTFHTQHHPAGRPVIAADGTLYVSTDGAVTALDKNGQVLGIALYDASVGEVSLSTGFMAQPATWINPGVRPSPVLGPDGTLYVWDGATIRAFNAGKIATSDAWIAPFGSPRNDGRIPQ